MKCRDKFIQQIGIEGYLTEPDDERPFYQLTSEFPLNPITPGKQSTLPRILYQRKKLGNAETPLHVNFH